MVRCSPEVSVGCKWKDRDLPLQWDMNEIREGRTHDNLLLLFVAYLSHSATGRRASAEFLLALLK